MYVCVCVCAYKYIHKYVFERNFFPLHLAKIDSPVWVNSSVIVESYSSSPPYSNLWINPCIPEAPTF